MKKRTYIAVLLLSFSATSFAQEEISDEFEIEEPGVEINSSKEAIRPSGEMKDVLESSPFDTGNNRTTEAPTSDSFDLSTAPQEAAAQEAAAEEANQDSEADTILVRTRDEDQSSIVANPSGLVEVRMPVDNFLPYKKRQRDWGFLISFGAEQTKFPNLLTTVGQNQVTPDDFTFAEMFGKNGIQMFNIELGPKYNTSAGSFAFLASYGTASKKDSRLGAEGEVTFTRYALSVVYYVDTIFDEAYFIPYVGGGAWQADYRETSEAWPGEVGKYSTDPGMQYRFGALLGLDWIEGDAARVSRRTNGTNGTFLNVYAISTMMSESDPEVNLENEMDLGASLVIEF